MKIELQAYGKVNLGLDVLRRRPDGYHEVKMIMQTVKLHDTLTFETVDEDVIVLSTNADELPVNEDNLVYKACRMLKQEYQITRDQTVESCVNLVGVNVNTASKHLLTYVSGLGPTLAQNIVDYRTENGPFESRRQLLKVPRMGAKAYEQCAGFLRIPQAKNPLDNSAVHPESYPIVEQMAKDLNCTVADLIKDKELRGKIDLKKYVTDTIGLPTLTDILQELDKPGRDPRQKIQVFEFDKNVRTLDDLQEGMELPGIVTNITNFGCFVDIGIKENGLVHVSQLADRFVSNPADVVRIHQHVRVKVMSIDHERKRIQLTMKGLNN